MSTLKVSSIQNPSTSNGGVSIDTSGNVTLPRVSSINAGQLAGFRNQIMNGAMDINQRGGPYTHAVAAAVAPCLDRWFMSGNPANTISVQQFSLPTGPFAKAIQWQSADVNTTALNLIELPAAGTFGPFRNGTTWTLSVYSNIAPPFGQLLWTTASTAGGTPAAGPPVAFVDTGEATGTPGWNRYSATFTINSTPAAGDIALTVAIFLPSGASYFTGVQLEPGPVATPFEHRPIGTELALCQRYYSRLQRVTLARWVGGGTYGGGMTHFTLPQTMRGTPSVTRSVNSGNYDDPTFRLSSTDGAVWFSSGTTIGDQIEYTLKFDSEL